MKLEDSFEVLAGRQTKPNERVLRELQRELDESPANSRIPVRRDRLMWSAACSFAGLMFTTWGVRGTSWIYLIAVAAVVSVLTAGWLFPRALPGAARRMGLGGRRTLMGGLAVGLLVALGAAAQFFVNWDDAFHGPSLFRTLSCLLHAMLTGAIIAGALVLIWRKTDPFTPSWTGALFGAVGGLLGAASVSFVCASCEGWHMTVGHGSAILLLMLLGGLAGNRWLQP